MDAQDNRIAAVVGETDDDYTFERAIDRFFSYLQQSLVLPCDVTGIEDFRWEAFYVIGPGDPEEYSDLRRRLPSYQDVYVLLGVEKDMHAEWMKFRSDLAARVRRKSDGKEFLLGLSELKAVDEESKNHQLLDDYGAWFAISY